MNPFLEETIASIRIENSTFSNAIFILPSKRAKIFLLEALTPHLPKPHFIPTIYSVEEFIASLSQLKKAPQLELLFSLYAAYHKTMPKDKQDSFDLFLQWAPPLLKDFNDIDAFLLNPKDVLSDLNAYYALEVDNEKQNNTAFTPVFWSNLLTLYHEFTSTLLEKNWGTMGMLYREALDGIQIYLDQTIHKHYFIGFNALNTAEEYLFQEFLTAQKAQIYWDLDQQFFLDSSHASGRFIRRYHKKWTYYRNHPYRFEQNHFSSPKKIQAHGFIGNIPQAQYVSQLLQEEVNTDEPTVVVLGNENFLPPVLAHLPTTLDNWNVTMGYSINQQPLVQFFRHYFTLHAHDITLEIDRKALLPLFHFSPLRSHFFHQYPHQKKALISLFHGYGEVKLDKDYPWLLKDPLGALLFHPTNTPRVCIEQAIAVLVKMKQLFYSKEKEHLPLTVIGLISECLIQLEKHIQSATFPLTNTVLAALFEELISAQKIDFKGDPTAGVQFMGMLETRTLDFKNVIVTHLNEGILPVGKNDQSFFPFALKKHYGLPTFLDNDAIYTYHFYRLLQRAENIYLLYNAKREGLDAGEKSRFIYQLAFADNPVHQFSDQLVSPSIPQSRSLPQAITKDDSMIKALEQLAQDGFSPTSLSSYLVNPIDFYTRYLLGIKEVKAAGGTLSHLKRGDIVHTTLELLYTPYIGKQLQPSDYDEMLSRLNTVLESSYREAQPFVSQITGENMLIIRAYERAIKQFLMQELAAISKGEQLTIIALEKAFKVQLPKTAFPFPVYIKGTIDRMDRYNDQLRIIDYKTGTVEKSKLKVSDWSKFRGDYKYQALFQVLLYAWSQQEEYAKEYPITAGVVSLKSPKENILPVVRQGVQKNENIPAIDQVFVSEIQEFITELIQEIFDEQNSFVSLG